MRLLLSLVSLSVLSACGTFTPVVIDTQRNIEKEEITLDENEPIGGEVPHEVNAQVNKWVKYFTGRGRRHMERYLSRSTRYEAVMKQILREEQVPEDLFYVALIESGFRSSARSHANAVGYWQFIRGTGRAYGLQINAVMDERRDPELATRAAARYLKSLHTLFNDWYLAIAAYNVGENRVKRLVMRYQTRDFWTLARRRKLPRETINYVPKYLAARMIAKRPTQYGFDKVEYQPGLDFETLQVSYPVNLKTLAGKLGIGVDEFKEFYNPTYLTDYAPTTKKRGGLTLRIPKGKLYAAQEYALESKVVDVAQMNRLLNTKYAYHRVRRGDTLSGIAVRYRTSIRTLKRINRLGRRNLIRVGQRLNVPLYSGARILASSSPSAKVASYSGEKTIHRVRRGESLGVIAEKYGVGLSKVLRANSLSKRSKIYVGQKIIIPGKHSIKTTQRHGSSYVVKRGETLLGISNRTGVSLSNLLKYNGLNRRSKIYVGQKINLTASRSVASKKVHRVRRGETLSHIAVKYGVAIRQIAQANGIKRNHRIQIGESLVIPH
ncbi:MAG: LysM peptidoglycan-binding domain-containing protein [Bdellovibrionota bacterium]|nr:LysM peptidoglycan-binding domain-containing protein [Bdellovibrionota bacterium]